MAELEAQLFSTKDFNPRIQDANFPCVCLNDSGTVVVFYQSRGKGYYVIGNTDLQHEHDTSKSSLNSKHRLDWGDAQLYGDGCNVQAAINEQNEVVLVRSRTGRRECMYRVGNVDVSAKCINWWSNEMCLCSGVNPTVALVGNTVLFVYEVAYGLYRCYYEVSKIENKQIWASRNLKARLIPELNGCKEVSIAINQSGQVVITCRNALGSGLYCAVGSLIDATLCDVMLNGTPYVRGYYSSVSVLNNGIVASAHQDEAFGSSSLKLLCGRVSDSVINWEEEQELDHGYKPSLAVSNKQQMIVVHVDKSGVQTHGELKYKFGTLSSRLQ